LKFSVDENLALHAICKEGEPVLIGYSSISYKDGKFVYSLELMFNDSGTVRITYDVNGASFTNFNDPWTDPENPREYNSLQGTVNEFITPTDWSTAETISNLDKLTTAQVDVVLEVVE